ncbi:MAG: cobalamin-binding protein [Kangiellaceae bacterium]|nr:cobalamin-binding protein [Kangiellaceae bacterium]MCW9015558.1 cobalamin-binding protein [Kangiellaceae bacterium]
MRQLAFIFLLLIASNATSEELKKKRIIALSPHAVEMLFEIGVGDQIVATVERADYPEEAKDIPRIGNYVGIQIEKLVALQPDLVVAWKGGNQKADLERIKSLGFQIYDSHPQNIAEVNQNLIELGKLLGVEEAASEASQKLMADYQAIINQYKDKPKVRAFYQLWHDPMRTVGPDNWVGSLMKDCGGENIFAEAKAGYPLVSFESILVKNPESIIIPHHSGVVGAKKDIWANWKNIKAVKNNQIHAIDGNVILRSSPRALEGLALLCNAIDEARKYQK